MTWLFVAFGIVWAGFFIYLFGLQSKLGQMARELEDLKR